MISLPADAGFLIDGLQLTAGRVDADPKVVGGRFERSFFQEPGGEPRLRGREPEGADERLPVRRQACAEIDENHKPYTGRQSDQRLGWRPGGIGDDRTAEAPGENEGA